MRWTRGYAVKFVFATVVGVGLGALVCGSTALGLAQWLLRDMQGHPIGVGFVMLLLGGVLAMPGTLLGAAVFQWMAVWGQQGRLGMWRWLRCTALGSLPLLPLLATAVYAYNAGHHPWAWAAAALGIAAFSGLQMRALNTTPVGTARAAMLTFAGYMLVCAAVIWGVELQAHPVALVGLVLQVGLGLTLVSIPPLLGAMPAPRA